MSPFEIVYGRNPDTPLSLVPLPPADYMDIGGANKAESMKKVFEKVHGNIERTNEQIRTRINKKRRELIFQPGDWVWLHMRPERFPSKRKHKLDFRGDGPFKVLERINDNAYRLELPGEFNVSSSFNVIDLSPFDADDVGSLETKALEEGGNDGVIKATPRRYHEEEAAPNIPHRIMTRSRAQEVKGKIQGLVHHLRNEEKEANTSRIQQDDHEDILAHSFGDKAVCVLTIIG